MREAFVKKREALINCGKHMKRSNKIYKGEALINCRMQYERSGRMYSRETHVMQCEFDTN